MRPCFAGFSSAWAVVVVPLMNNAAMTGRSQNRLDLLRDVIDDVMFLRLRLSLFCSTLYFSQTAESLAFSFCPQISQIRNKKSNKHSRLFLYPGVPRNLRTTSFFIFFLTSDPAVIVSRKKSEDSLPSARLSFLSF